MRVSAQVELRGGNSSNEGNVWALNRSGTLIYYNTSLEPMLQGRVHGPSVRLPGSRAAAVGPARGQCRLQVAVSLMLEFFYS